MVGRKESDRGVEEKLIVLAGIGGAGREGSDPDIGAIAEAVRRAFPAWQVRRACTGEKSDDLEKKLGQAARDGVREVVVQPVYLLQGHKYTELIHTLKKQEHLFERVIPGTPLFSGEADMDAAANALYGRTMGYDDGETVLCFLGHGAQTDANRGYRGLQEKFSEAGYENCYVAVMKNTPSLEDAMTLWERKKRYKRVVLFPLMAAAGVHVKVDMMGGQKDSVRSILEIAGYEVLCIAEGLGRLPEIQDIYVEHIRSALPVS